METYITFAEVPYDSPEITSTWAVERVDGYDRFSTVAGVKRSAKNYLDDGGVYKVQIAGPFGDGKYQGFIYQV